MAKGKRPVWSQAGRDFWARRKATCGEHHSDLMNPAEVYEAIRASFRDDSAESSSKPVTNSRSAFMGAPWGTGELAAAGMSPRHLLIPTHTFTHSSRFPNILARRNRVCRARRRHRRKRKTAPGQGRRSDQYETFHPISPHLQPETDYTVAILTQTAPESVSRSNRASEAWARNNSAAQTAIVWKGKPRLASRRLRTISPVPSR